MSDPRSVSSGLRLVSIGVLSALIVGWLFYVVLHWAIPDYEKRRGQLGYTVTVHDGPAKLDFHAVARIIRGIETVLILDDGAEVRIHSGTVIIRPRDSTAGTAPSSERNQE